MSTTTVTPTLAVAGNTANRMTAWLDLTTDRAILQSVTGFRFILDDTPMQIGLPREYKFNKAQSQFIDDHIKELVQKGAIAEIWSLVGWLVEWGVYALSASKVFGGLLCVEYLSQAKAQQQFQNDYRP